MKRFVYLCLIVSAAGCSSGSGSNNGGKSGGNASVNADGTCSQKTIDDVNSYAKNCVAWGQSDNESTRTQMLATCRDVTGNHSASVECQAQSFFSSSSDENTKACFGFSKNSSVPTGRVLLKMEVIHKICGVITEKYGPKTNVNSGAAASGQSSGSTRSVRFADVDAQKLSVQVLNLEKVKKLSPGIGTSAAVDGEVGAIDDLVSKIASNRAMFCGLVGTGWTDVTASQTLKVLEAKETLRRSDRNSVSIILAPNLAIACQNMTGEAISTGEVNATLAGILSLKIED